MAQGLKRQDSSAIIRPGISRYIPQFMVRANRRYHSETIGKFSGHQTFRDEFYTSYLVPYLSLLILLVIPSVTWRLLSTPIVIDHRYVFTAYRVRS